MHDAQCLPHGHCFSVGMAPNVEVLCVKERFHTLVQVVQFTVTWSEGDFSLAHGLSLFWEYLFGTKLAK